MFEIARSIILAIIFISSSFIPRDVKAAEPILTPDVNQGPFSSNGTVFRLTVMSPSRKAFSP